MAAALCRSFEVLIEVGFGDASRAEPICGAGDAQNDGRHREDPTSGAAPDE